MGKDEDKGCFYRFIDDNYFAFYFRQWAAFFITVGILCIIAGIVVFFVLPQSKQAEITGNQLVKDENSKNYKYWKENTDQIKYEFQNIDSMSDSGVSCSTIGPFVFSAKVAKASASFKGDLVDYQLTVTKNFNDAQSQPIGGATPVSLLNQRYIELAENKTSETELLIAAFKNSTLVDDVQTYFETIGPKLIAARGIGQSFQDSVKTMREGVIFPGLFGKLGDSVADYQLQHQINGLNEKLCVGCAGSIKGMYNNLYTRWIQDSTCQNGVSPINADTFYPRLINGFPGSSDCITFLNAHKLDSTKWDAVTDRTLVQTLLETTKSVILNQWYDPTAPRSLGYCHDKNAAVTAFSASLPQITDFCNLIDSMLNTIDTPANIGEQAFCGGFNGIPMTFSKDVPTDAVGTNYPSIPLNYTTTFDLATCNGYISALTDVPNFVIPLYNGKSEDITGHTFSPSELTMLLNYIKKFENTMKRWFVSAWRGDSAYTCPSCVISGLSNTTLFDKTEDGLIEFLFPELSNASKDAKTKYSLSQPDPKPLGANSIFDDFGDATGILNYQLNIENTQSLYGFSDNQYTAILAYVDTLTNNYYAKLKADYNLDSSLTNQISTGYYQFASAKLACGPKGTGYCSIATAFYGIAPGVEDFEFGLCSYVANDTQTYYRSFTTADQTLRDSTKDTFINGLFSQLQSPESMVGNDDPAQKYLFYLLSKYMYDSYFSATSGLIATRPGAQWVSGFTDNAIALLKGDANISPSFGFDVDGTVASVELNTGATDVKKANTLSLFNGATTIQAYAQSETIKDLVTIEGVPINVFSDGAKVKYFDMDLKRTFTFVVSDGEDVNNVPTKKGVVSSDDWKVNPVFGITTDYLMPNSLKDGTYLSPCTVSLNTQCAFPAAADRVHQIQIDPQTGFTMTFDNCVIQTLDLGMAYNFSSPNGTPENKLVSQVRKTTSRRVNPDMITGYLSEFQQVNSTAQAVLIALVVVGSLFVIAGLILVAFWFIRRSRKDLIASETPLVDDPFQEKKKEQVTTRY